MENENVVDKMKMMKKEIDKIRVITLSKEHLAIAVNLCVNKDHANRSLWQSRFLQIDAMLSKMQTDYQIQQNENTSEINSLQSKSSVNFCDSSTDMIQKHQNFSAQYQLPDAFVSFVNHLKSSTTKDEFISKLKATTILVVPVRWISLLHGNRRLESHSGSRDTTSNTSSQKTYKKKTETKNQDERDIERDTISITITQNEHPIKTTLLKGASEGYFKIISALVEEMKHLIHANNQAFHHNQLTVSQEEMLFSFSRALLHAINRTRSGGETYEAIERIIRCENLSIITPDSVAAEPLEIVLDVGTFKRTTVVPLTKVECKESSTIIHESFEAEEISHWDFGLRAILRGKSYYRLTDLDPEDEHTPHFAKIKGVFSQTLGLPLPLAQYPLPVPRHYTDDYFVERYHILSENGSGDGQIELLLSI